MSGPSRFHIADFGGEVGEVVSNAGKGLYQEVTINWTTPTEWAKDQPAPISLAKDAPGHLYCLVWDHHRLKTKENMVYVGITNNLKRRFYLHPKAKELVAKRGKTSLSVGNIDFGRRWSGLKYNKQAIEELEHLLIWALWPELNEKKIYTLPGLGDRACRAWHIRNAGHRFAGQMPLEVVYPWMLVRPGRYRALKVP